MSSRQASAELPVEITSDAIPEEALAAGFSCLNLCCRTEASIEDYADSVAALIAAWRESAASG